MDTVSKHYNNPTLQQVNNLFEKNIVHVQDSFVKIMVELKHLFSNHQTLPQPSLSRSWWNPNPTNFNFNFDSKNHIYYKVSIKR